MYRGLSRSLAVITIGLGVVLLVSSATRGGGVIGFAIGIAFVIAGVGRLYLSKMR